MTKKMYQEAYGDDELKSLNSSRFPNIKFFFIKLMRCFKENFLYLNSKEINDVQAIKRVKYK